jgi:putative effector of murein hydrolase
MAIKLFRWSSENFLNGSRYQPFFISSVLYRQWDKPFVIPFLVAIFLVLSVYASMDAGSFSGCYNVEFQLVESLMLSNAVYFSMQFRFLRLLRIILNKNYSFLSEKSSH